MNVALVTSTGQCGIAEHSRMLQESVNAAAGIEFRTDPAWLDPQQLAGRYDVVHLNYHRGLHSRWTPEVIARYAPTPFVITFHDTYDVQPDRLAWDLLDCPNVKGMVVHEPCDLESHLKVHYWQQPCPLPAGRGSARPFAFTQDTWRPTLGTLGWDFPWKNYTMLAQVTGELGWNLLIIGQVTPERRAELVQHNPRIFFEGYQADTRKAVAALSACDATAFIYTCANSGTSGAIRVGMTAGKPLIAAVGCRQFRDLIDTEEGRHILWIDPIAEELRDTLKNRVQYRSGPGGFDTGLVAAAHDLSWTKVGPKYAALYRAAVQA